jgi:DNA-binding transcriptional LysR family regulator
MRREKLADLEVFLAVAEERSFTHAAAKLGTSQSALSHTVTRLESRLGVRLLARTTRSVAPTEAGERLLHTLRPALDEIDQQLAALNEFRGKPAGTIRITAGDHPAETILWPVVRRLLPEYPDIKFEVNVETGLTDIIGDRFDAGIRLGERIAKDMIAVRVGPDMRMAVVGSPSYFAQRKRPRTPHDLQDHDCINFRFPTSGGLYAWEFERGGRELKVRVDGHLIFNNVSMTCKAVLEGLGLAFLPESQVENAIAERRLIRVLEAWCQPFPGYHLYYPSRRQQSPAFSVFIEALRHRA